MEIKQGYSYHIKDEFFLMLQDKFLMSNKENGRYRPHYYAIQDKTNPQIYWMIPISSQVEKYKKIIKQKEKKYGKCNTIVIGKFAGKDNAFLIQNAFPIISKYLDHIHVIEGRPIKVHKNLNKNLTDNLKTILSMYASGVNLFFTDIQNILSIIEKELNNS